MDGGAHPDEGRAVAKKKDLCSETLRVQCEEDEV